MDYKSNKVLYMICYSKRRINIKWRSIYQGCTKTKGKQAKGGVGQIEDCGEKGFHLQ